MEPVAKLNLDWTKFNHLLDELDPTQKYDLESKDRNTVLPNTFENYPPEICTYGCYMDKQIDQFVDESFLFQLNLDPNSCVIKVLEHKPGTFTVPHYDYYKEYIEKQQVSNKEVTRLWIPCKDGEIGHALLFEKSAIYNYKAGDVYIVPGDQIHAGVNAGISNRRIMTITGFKSGAHTHS